ncbi:hypothetical protein CV102_04715 [Natronococcus pandeyae]|uniref:DUF7344 domain-containing protein n=1 Tax=Natronococcus pandeyae TaxID=2055836 RepID=A0A8J8Q697_9EURY|nr:hypothetical protein [Natronococcus pandeyae]TYL39597.1 hypothetical protein CV102_04715 [Natronococcus pandeyae]
MTIHPDRTTAVPEQLSSENVCLRAISRVEFGRVLANDRRREVLRYLLAADEPITIQRLVGWLADTENENAVLTTIHELRQRVHVALCRTHLPLLERYGIVQYDRERGLVSPAANLSEFEAAIDGVDLERPW